MPPVTLKGVHTCSAACFKESRMLYNSRHANNVTKNQFLIFKSHFIVSNVSTFTLR